LQTNNIFNGSVLEYTAIVYIIKTLDENTKESLNYKIVKK